MEDKPFLHAFLFVFSWQPLATKYLFSCANVKDSLELPWLNKLKVRAEVRIYWKQLLCMNLVDKCFVCFELLCSFYFLAIETYVLVNLQVKHLMATMLVERARQYYLCQFHKSLKNHWIFLQKKNTWFMFKMIYLLMCFFSILLEALVDEHWKHSLSGLANLAFQRWMNNMRVEHINLMNVVKYSTWSRSFQNRLTTGLALAVHSVENSNKVDSYTIDVSQAIHYKMWCNEQGWTRQQKSHSIYIYLICFTLMYLCWIWCCQLSFFHRCLSSLRTCYRLSLDIWFHEVIAIRTESLRPFRGEGKRWHQIANCRL